MTGRGAGLLLTTLAQCCLLGCGETSSSGPAWTLPDAAAGNGGLGAAGKGNEPAPTTPGSAPTMHSMWGMVGFEDPVAINFAENVGCFVGYPTRDNLGNNCGELRVLDNQYPHLTFAMSFGATAPNVTYAADVYVAEDGSRMAGTFGSFMRRSDEPLPEPQTWPLGYAWLPIGEAAPANADDDSFAVPAHTLPRDALPVPENGSALQLVTDENGAGELEPAHVYFWGLRDTGRGLAIVGDVGAFFDTEIRWDAATQTLSAGPVAATRPGYPIALEIHYADDRVSTALATTASGARYTLQRVERP